MLNEVLIYDHYKQLLQQLHAAVSAHDDIDTLVVSAKLVEFTEAIQLFGFKMVVPDEFNDWREAFRRVREH